VALLVTNVAVVALGALVLICKHKQGWLEMFFLGRAFAGDAMLAHFGLVCLWKWGCVAHCFALRSSNTMILYCNAAVKSRDDQFSGQSLPEAQENSARKRANCANLWLNFHLRV